MTSAIPCPGSDRLSAHLAGKLAAAEEQAVIAHLDGCQTCQQTLEELAAGGKTLLVVARDVGHDPPPEAPSSGWRARSTESIELPEATPDLPAGFLAPPDKPGRLGQLDRYEVIETIGHGGMGVVLKAIDRSLQRIVAIKVLAAHLATSPGARKRFIREAQAAAAVRNDHVISIYAVEESRELPYLVMEYIEGVSLEERIRGAAPLGLKEILRIGMQTAAGLAAAHAQGLVHRDIKPANILLENGVQRVKITDFGLARTVDDASLTQSGIVAGTPQYMAPEQARGEPVDQRTDLFSLGSVLYTLCTGRAPFRAEGTMAVLKRVCEDRSRPIREINPEIPDWLVETIDRLHAKNPADRWQSASELADLFERQLAYLQHPTGEPPPRPPPVRPASQARGRVRNVALAAFVIVAAGLVLTELSGLTRLTAPVRRLIPAGVARDDSHATDKDRGQSDIRRDPQKSVVEETQTTDPKPAGLALPRLPVLDQLQESDIPPAERFPWQPRELVAVLGEHRQRHWDTIRTVTFSPDGKLFASAGHDRQICLVDAGTMHMQLVLSGHAREIYGVAFSPDSRRLLSTGADGTIRLWDLSTGRERLRFQGPDVSTNCVAFSADGRRAISGSDDALVRVWDIDTGWELRRFAGHEAAVGPVEFSRDGQRAISASLDRTARVWDVATGRQISKFAEHRGMVQGLAFLPDGRRALSSNYLLGSDSGQSSPADYSLRLWDVETGAELHRFEGHQQPVVTLAVSADGHRAASCSLDGTVRVWDLESGAELARIAHDRVSGRAGVGQMWTVALSPDGSQVAYGGAGFYRAVRVWGIDRNKELFPLSGHFGIASSIALSIDGQYALTGSWYETAVRLWDVATRRELRPFLGHTDGIWCTGFAPDSQFVLSGSADRTLKLWEVDRRKAVHSFEGHTGAVNMFAVSPDGRRAVTAGWFNGDETVRHWDLENQRELGRFVGHARGGVDYVAYAPDGERVATAGGDHSVRVWDANTREQLDSCMGHTGQVLCVAFSPDGSQLASSDVDGTVWTWRPEQGLVTGRQFPRRHQTHVRSVAWAPSGSALATCDIDGLVVIWDAATGSRLREWKFPGWVNMVAFAADGRHLLTANGNGTIYILRLDDDADTAIAGETGSGAGRVGAEAESPKFDPQAAVAHGLRGAYLQCQGDLDGAISEIHKAVAIREQLTILDPNDAEWQAQLGTTLEDLSDLHRVKGQLDEARRLLERAIRCQTIAREADPDEETYQRSLREHQAKLAVVLTLAGNHAAAADVALDMLRTSPDDWRTCHIAARTLSDCASVALRDTALQESERRKQAARYGAQMREALQKAVRCGATAVAGALEAEVLPVVETSGINADLQKMNTWGMEQWSNGHQILCQYRQNDYVVLEFELAKAARCRLEVWFTRASDYGIVEVSLDGQRVGQLFDGFSPAVVPSGPIEFGVSDMSAGKHRLRFRAIDRNPKSSAYMMGIDCLRLSPVEE
jgi:WD40 repeat protein/serine/threonine protein kinase/tetratricopeptide (TPR) repeat protein